MRRAVTHSSLWYAYGHMLTDGTNQAGGLETKPAAGTRIKVTLYAELEIKTFFNASFLHAIQKLKVLRIPSVSSKLTDNMFREHKKSWPALPTNGQYVLRRKDEASGITGQFDGVRVFDVVNRVSVVLSPAYKNKRSEMGCPVLPKFMLVLAGSYREMHD